MDRLSSDEWRTYQNTTICHICENTIGEEQVKVRDHDHLTGKYRGPAHSDCNLQYRINPTKVKIPCVIHNLKNYDAHLILSAIKPRHGEVTCIPNTNEKYTSFTVGGVTFIDSCQFMMSSLDRLASNLISFPETEKYIELDVAEQLQQYDDMLDDLLDEGDGEEDNQTNEMLESDYRNSPYEKPILDDEQSMMFATRRELMTRKGVYPYEYFDRWEKFDESHLPSQDCFYSRLTNNGISTTDYDHAQRVFTMMEMESLRDYHDFYLLCDVLLLADVFEAFRDTCMQHYQLDPAHFYTAPGLSWQAALKMTEVKLELLTDIDQHLFIEDGIRGGVAVINHRYAKANLPDLPGYDASKPKEHLIYWDANNLYGWAMSQSLPTGNFNWLSEQEIESLNLEAVGEDAEVGYILEVDLEYPNHLHDMHADYPLAPERMPVRPEMLSEKQREIYQQIRGNDEIHGTLPKLIPNLLGKTNYVVHYWNLKLYLELGMILKKVHKVLSFQQSPWLKTYIDFNTQQRTMARNEFEKDFFKLMNNSMFGKTMENLRNRRKIDLITGERRLKKLAAQPTFKSFTIFHEDLLAVERTVAKLTLNRPIYTGLCVLDISKILMYNWHYKCQTTLSWK